MVLLGETINQVNKQWSIVLASQSPRRKEMITSLGLHFSTCASPYDEKSLSWREFDSVQAYVSHNAKSKVMAVVEASSFDERTLVIGSDTIVVHDGVVLEKPTSEANALATLTALAGNTHQVMTSVFIWTQAATRAFVSTTEVTFISATEDDLLAYIATGEPMDKAGSYGIQGLGGLLVEGISGDYQTVVGLPLRRVCEAIEDIHMQYGT
ncbi:septum formation inhibitor Maf [Carpediemonas membranifera]|uniref:Septum formation inhibitor Maf n=1 Tax=Carpediemonas membranifera TaxID=201153 RepID=A0A8J6AYI0_9EUKA|nr:septum formation inhibitor Maf [Carpediemonas membranifera]|eukprot:KAG9397183.1 septum formation inhibitor Maf [Carpediemonas membranifera]